VHFFRNTGRPSADKGVGVSRHLVTPREAMLLYRAQLLREDEERRLLESQGPVPPPPTGKIVPPNELATQEKAFDKVGRQDDATAKNRKAFKAQQAGIEGDQELDAAAMAALYARLPGHHQPPAGNVVQTMATATKTDGIRRRRVHHKTGSSQLAEKKSGAPLIPHMSSVRANQGGAKVVSMPHRTHVPQFGAVAIA
jgi:hypothetical protein